MALGWLQGFVTFRLLTLTSCQQIPPLAEQSEKESIHFGLRLFLRPNSSISWGGSITWRRGQRQSVKPRHRSSSHCVAQPDVLAFAEERERRKSEESSPTPSWGRRPETA